MNSNLEQRIFFLEKKLKSKRFAESSQWDDKYEYLINKFGDFGNYDDAVQFKSEREAKYYSRRSKGSGIEDGNSSSTWVVSRPLNLSPWKSEEELLKSMVYHLEKEWNGNYDSLREVLKPSIRAIYKRLIMLSQG